MSNRAWVTLATNDSYSLGALVLAHSLRRVASAYPTVVMITPAVTDNMRGRLGAVFSEVVVVDVLDSRDAAHLALLSRPELGITFTKIHCWTLTQYDKCVFLDADTLVVQNCDELFEREELSAAPDVGWPDCFNSGVFVYKPSADTFSSLLDFAKERGSFDGGDQGLLNSYFSDWAHADISKHLPFLYNVTSAAFYSYLPALKHFGQDLKIIHFIGNAKPWLQNFNWESRSVDAPGHLQATLQAWWDLFVAHVHPQLDATMVEGEDFDAIVEPHTPHYKIEVDPQSQFPWHRPVAEVTQNTQQKYIDKCLAAFHDPWENYRGNVQPDRGDPEKENTQIQSRVEVFCTPNVDWTSYKISTHSEAKAYHCEQPETQNFASNNNKGSHNSYNWEQSNDTQSHDSASNQQFHEAHTSADNKNVFHSEETPQESLQNGDIDSSDENAESETESCVEKIVPRHPYDNYYLRHQPVVDPCGRKRCSHEPHAPTPSPPPPVEEPQVNGDQAGLAGTLAQLTLGTGAPQQAALDELTRRQGWEAGNIDYMGVDAFANIWAKISQTLAQPPPAQQQQPAAEPAAPAPSPAETQDPEPQKPAEQLPAEEPKPESEPQAAEPPIVPAPAEPSKPVEAPAAEQTVKDLEVPASKSAPAAKAPESPAAPEKAQESPAAPASVPESPVAPAKALESPAATTIAPESPAAPAKAPESPATPAKAPESTNVETPKTLAAATTPLKELAQSTSATDSPPLVFTPTKDDAASPKSAEEGKGDTAPSEGAQKLDRKAPKDKLNCQLKPCAEPAPLLTPDSELEDADTLAQSIIASELTPTTPNVISATPPIAATPTPPVHKNEKRLSVDEPLLETPPATAPVSLAQIGVLPKLDASATQPEKKDAGALEKTKTVPAVPSDKLACEATGPKHQKEESAPTSPIALESTKVEVSAEPLKERVTSAEQIKVTTEPSVEPAVTKSLKSPVPTVTEKAPTAPVLEKTPVPSVPQKVPSTPESEKAPVPVVAQKAPSKPEPEKAPVSVVTQKVPSTPEPEKAPVPVVAQKAPSKPEPEKAPGPEVAQKAPSKPEPEKAPVPVVAQRAPSKPEPEKVPVPAVAEKAPSTPETEKAVAPIVQNAPKVKAPASPTTATTPPAVPTETSDKTEPLKSETKPADAPVEPPKKKIVKKVIKKVSVESTEKAVAPKPEESVAAGPASPPVPPPRKKEKLPKEK